VLLLDYERALLVVGRQEVTFHVEPAEHTASQQTADTAAATGMQQHTAVHVGINCMFTLPAILKGQVLSHSRMEHNYKAPAHQCPMHKPAHIIGTQLETIETAT
jgi:hypothetical protein